MNTIEDYNAWAKKQQDQSAAAASVVLGASEDKPDDVANALNLAHDFAKTTGNPVPPLPLVKEYKGDFQTAIDAAKAKTVLSSSPRLASWLSNTENAAIAKDDLEGLSWWEYAGKQAVEVPKAVPGGAVSSAGLAMEGAGQLLTPVDPSVRNPLAERILHADTLTPDQLGQLRQDIFRQGDINPQIAQTVLSGVLAGDMTPGEAMDQLGPMFTPALKATSDALQQGGETTQEFGNSILPAAPGMEESMGRQIGSGLGSLLTILGVGMLTGGVGAATFGGAMGAGEASANARKAGQDEDTQTIAAFYGLLPGMTDAIPVERLLNNPVTKAGFAALLRSVGKQALTEGGQEAIQQIMQNAIAHNLYAPDKSMLDDVMSNFATGGIVGAMAEAGKIGLELLLPGRLRAGRAHVERAQADREKLEEISTNAQGSVLRGRSPDKFRQFVETATAGTPVENVFVPASEFNQYFQTIGVDPRDFIDSLEGVTAEDFDAMLASGGDLRIPTATYAAKIAGTEHDAFLLDNMRFDPEAMTFNEAKAFNEQSEYLREEAWEEAEASRLHEEATRSTEAKIYDMMVSRLRLAGRSTDVATTEAMLYPDFYRVQAEHEGLTTEEFLQKYPLPQVAGDLPQGMQFRDVDELTRTLAAIRTRKAVKDTRQSLLEFIDQHGGINDQGGELRARNATVVKRGRGKKSLRLARAAEAEGQGNMLGVGGTGRKHGADSVAQAAIEAGYLSDHPDAIEYRAAINEGREVPDITRALYDAIDAELRGEAQYAGEADKAFEEARRLDEIETYLGGLGVSLNDSDEEIRTAIEGARQYAQASNKGNTISTGPDGRTMLFDRIASDWKNHAKRILAGTAKHEVEVLRQSPVMAAVIGGKGRVMMNHIAAAAIRNKHRDIPAHVWEELPTLIADPVAVFVREDGAANIVISETTKEGSHIIVAVRDGQLRTITPVDPSESQSSAERLDAMIDAAMSRGGKIYVSGETSLPNLPMRSRANSAQRQPRAFQAGFIRQGRGAKIITRADVVNTAGRIFYQDMGGARGVIQFPASGIGNGETVIRLFQSANLSTMIHETGHFFLTVTQDLAAKGSARAAANLTTVKSWWRDNAKAVAADGKRAMPDAGVTADDVIKALDTGTTGDLVKDAAIDVGMQEQFARAFEAYLMEGKAPSVELRSAFEKFRSWLISVYRKVAGLNVKLSPELNAVFSRMIASDAQIAAAQQEAGDTPPLFATAAQMGLPDEEYAAFLNMREQAAEEAKARLLKEAMDPIRREEERAYKEQKARVREEVERNTNAFRYYRAMEWMGNRRWLGDGKPEELPDMRLSKDILVDRYGEGVLKTLPRGMQTVYTVEGGVDPDDAAGWFGFDSGDEMTKAMEQAPKRTDAIDAETERRMREEHGDMLNDGSAEEEALKVVHNDKRGQWIAAELEAVRKLTGDGPALTAKAARASARLTVARMRVRDAMNANRFLAAERRAADEAARLGAALSRDGYWDNRAQFVKFGEGHPTAKKFRDGVAKLYDAKRRQLVNHALYVEARKVAEEVEKAENFVARLGKKVTRERIAGAGRRDNATVDYLGAMDDILDRYDFRRMSQSQESRRASLAAFVDAMKAAGRENELSIPDAVLSQAGRAPYKTIPVEELRGVIDSLKNIEHIATRWNKLIDAQHEREFEKEVAGVLDAFDQNVKGSAPGRVGSAGENRKRSVRQYLDLVLNANTLLRSIDGFKDGGAAHAAIKAPIDAAANRLIARKQKAAEDLEKLYGVYSKKERRAMATRMHIPELGYALSKWEMLSVALNTGNEGNRQRLTDTRVPGSFTESQLAAVLSKLDARDADFVQSVWDYVGSFKGDLEAREKRVTGVAPSWVEAVPVTIGGRQLNGGYYPLQYDARLSSLARDDQANELSQSLMAGRFGKAQTRNGHLKERGQASGRPVELDMSVLHRHVDRVIYDLELSEPVANSWRVLQDGRIRSAFTNKGKSADFDALESWLLDVGTGELRAGDYASRLARHVKSNFTASKLALNLATAASQVAGLGQSMVVVGKRDFAVGVQQTFRPGILDEIVAKSPFMSQRQTTFNRDINDFYEDSKGGAAGSRWADFKTLAGKLGFWLMTKIQFHAVDVPTWLAGYHQGLRKFGNDEAKAIAHADDVVKRAQSSGLFHDRSSIERGTLSRTQRQSDIVKLFTALGSYMFTKMNIAAEKAGQFNRVRQDSGTFSTATGAAGISLALDMAALFAFDAVVMAAIKGQLPGDDEDDDSWPVFLAKQTGFSILGCLPFIRDAASVFQGFDGGGAYGSVVGTGTKGIMSLYNVVASPFSDDEAKLSDVKNIVNATGLATGLPSAQVNRAVDAAGRAAQGQDVSPLEYLFGRMSK